MATAIKLGKRPPHLEATVTFPMPDPDTGKLGTGSLVCRFKYRTQTEFGAWLDAKAQAHGLDAPAVTNNADLYHRVCENTADSLLDVLIGWDLPDQPLTPGTAMQLIDELPAAGLAILSAYREAITEGRLGN